MWVCVTDMHTNKVVLWAAPFNQKENTFLVNPGNVCEKNDEGLITIIIFLYEIHYFVKKKNYRTPLQSSFVIGSR